MIKLLEIYKSLNENTDTSNIENLFLTHVKQVWERWKEKYPEEPGINDPNYMDAEIKRSSIQYDLSWIDMIQNMQSTVNVTRGNKDCSKIKRACYYNSLDYIRRYDSEKINLAWGICVDLPGLMNALEKATKPENTSSYSSMLNRFSTLHAFLITDKNKVIDPTLGLSNKGNTYFYEIVPKEIWKKFTFKEADENFNAKDFADEYIAKVAGAKYNIDNIIKKWLLRNKFI